MKIIFAAVVVVFFGCYVEASNKTLHAKGFSIDVRGKSGKMTLKKGKKDVMVITPDYLGEKTEAGDKAGKHELQNFAKTDFTFTEPVHQTKYGLNVTTIDFTTTFTKDIEGSMTIKVIVFKEAGEIEAESGELLTVTAGSIKFNIEITGYKFCTPCTVGGTETTGKFLDFVMEMKGNKGSATKAKKGKGKKGKSKAKRDPETIYLGGSEVILSTMVKVDGEWKDMADTYPLIEQKGKKTLFTFRFPKFDTSLFYDPHAGEATETHSSGSMASQSLFLLMGSIVGYLVASM